MQDPIGETVLWFRFSPDASSFDEVYSEYNSENGGEWDQPIEVPVLVAAVYEGPHETEHGNYTVDQIHLVLSRDVADRLGLPLELDRDVLNDRIVHDKKVFKPTSIKVTGSIKHFEPVASVDGVQVSDDELTNVVIFEPYLSNAPLIPPFGDIV
jgi:hypothetical protein